MKKTIGSLLLSILIRRNYWENFWLVEEGAQETMNSATQNKKDEFRTISYSLFERRTSKYLMKGWMAIK